MSAKGITESDKHTDAAQHYSDIFNAPHWEPSSRSPSGLLTHPRMDIVRRAAMFASFDALVGYREAVTETARTTDARMELSEGELEELNRKLGIIMDRMEEGCGIGEMPSSILRSDTSSPIVSVTYFLPDSAKDGGSYVTTTGTVQKIDLFQRILTLADHSGSSEETIINIDDVTGIDGDIFAFYE